MAKVSGLTLGQVDSHGLSILDALAKELNPFIP